MHRALLPLLLAACDPSSNTDPLDRGEEDLWSPCTYTYTDLTLEEATALGFSAAELLAVVGGERVDTLTWIEDGSTVGLSLEIAWAEGRIRFVDAEPNTDGGDTGMTYDRTAKAEVPEDDPDTGEGRDDTAGTDDTGWEGYDCPDALSIEATLAFATDDGALAESFPVVLYAEALDGASFDGDRLVEEIAGSWTSDEYDPAEWEDLTLSVHGRVDAEASVGELLLSGSQIVEEEEDHDVGVAFQGLLASWPPEVEASER